MSEYTDVLERIGDRATMPEPALDRLVHRGERRRRDRRIVAGAIGILVGAGLVFALVRTRSPMTPRPGTTPNPSASNGLIAYTLAGQGVYLVREGQRPSLAIATAGDSGVEWCPTFSPDGAHLAFTREENGTVRTFEADISDAGVIAGSERLVGTSRGGNRQCPEWSPDSQGLLYADGREGQLFVDVGSDAPPIFVWRGIVGDVEWSPDGSLIAVSPLFDAYVWILSSQDGAVVEQVPGVHGSLSWSPTGETIAVAQTRDHPGGPPGVYLIDVASGRAERLGVSDRGFIGFGHASWSPDGRSLALGDNRDIDRGILIVRPEDDSWYRIRPPKLPVRDLWGGVRWSPDGQRLLTASGCSVYSIPIDGSGGWIQVSSQGVDPRVCQLPPNFDWQRAIT
jgi:Tol biopolymer transport system component